jgi:surface protein
MARTDTLGNFLADVADAIRTKKGSEEPIAAADFDTEIENLPSGGGADLNEYFYTEITENTSNSNKMTDKIIKKLADVVVDDSVTSLSYAYSGIVGIAGRAPKIICNSNVTTLDFLFQSHTGITSFDVSGLNTSNVTTMRRMFYCGNKDTLKSINFGSNFDTRKVTTMQEMFYGNRGLTSLDLSSFETPALTNTASMFSDCRALTFLDIRKMTFDNVSTSSSMFTNTMPNDCEIIVKSDIEKTWITGKFSFLTNVKTVAEYEAEQNA